MIDDRLPKALRFRFRLIDPKATRIWGQLGYGDPAYDFGKMFQSTSGCNDLIHVDYLRPEVNSGAFPRLVSKKWIELPLRGGMSAASVTTWSQDVQDWVEPLFRGTARVIEDVINEITDYVRKDPDWLIRAKFHEAAHMLAATPIHVRADVDRAIAVFVRGVELLNEFYEQYHGGGFPRPDETPGAEAFRREDVSDERR